MKTGIRTFKIYRRVQENHLQTLKIAIRTPVSPPKRRCVLLGARGGQQPYVTRVTSLWPAPIANGKHVPNNHSYVMSLAVFRCHSLHTSQIIRIRAYLLFNSSYTSKIIRSITGSFRWHHYKQAVYNKTLLEL